MNDLRTHLRCPRAVVSSEDTRLLRCTAGRGSDVVKWTVLHSLSNVGFKALNVSFACDSAASKKIAVRAVPGPPETVRVAGRKEHCASRTAAVARDGTLTICLHPRASGPA
jgi:hypothetical protein